MSSKAKKAAKLAAKQAAKKANEVKNQPAVEPAKVETPTPAPEEKKEPEKAQVNNQPVEKKEEAKAKLKPAVEEIKEEKKEPEKKEQKKKDKKIPTFIPEEVDHEKVLERANKLSQIPIGNTTSSMEGKAMLSYVMWEKYGKNEELKKQYPELYQDICRNIDFVNFLALCDLKQDAIRRAQSGEFKLTVDIDQIAPLQEMAGMLGVELTPTKALPGDKKQLELAFKEDTPLAKPKAKLEVPELDPSRITTDEELKSALNYKLSETPNGAVNIANAMQWFREYELFKASDADAKLKIDNKTVSELINEMFQKVQPTALLKGIGRAVYLYTKRDGSPIVAHTVLHHHLAPLGYSEDAIADIVRCLIGEQFRYTLNTDKNANNDPKTDKAIQAITSNLGNDYIDALFNDWAISRDTKDNEQIDRRNRANEIIGRVRTQYLPKKDSGETFSEDTIRMAIGKIINLYRDPSDPLAEYTDSSYISPKTGEYPKKLSVDITVKKK